MSLILMQKPRWRATSSCSRPPPEYDIFFLLPIHFKVIGLLGDHVDGINPVCIPIIRQPKAVRETMRRTASLSHNNSDLGSQYR